jgi:acetyl-CoA acetyltransferase
MARHPLQEVVIAGVYQTQQGRSLPGATSRGLLFESIRGALADTGLRHKDVDGIACNGVPGLGLHPLVYQLGINASWYTDDVRIGGVVNAALAIAAGLCDVVVVAAAQAGAYTDRAAVVPWTRQPNEFVECWGFTTPGEMAMMARRHMHLYGTTPEQIAHVAATVRNNGYIHPLAAHYDRGPITVEDVLNSRMLADPLHLLDVCLVTEGGAALVLTSVERARDLPSQPVYLLGGAAELVGPSHTHPLVWEFSGEIGRRAADRAFAMAGIAREDVDTCEFYDPVSWEIIRQFEVYGFCGPGEGGDFVSGGTIERTGRYPTCTDGGLLSFSHPGSAQFLNKIIAGVTQLRGTCGPRQVPDPRISMISNGAAAAFKTDVLLIGKEQA